MTGKKTALRDLEGTHVCVALRDGTRIDDCMLVSVGGGSVSTMWVFTNGDDRFVRHDDVLDIWSCSSIGRRYAA